MSTKYPYTKMLAPYRTPIVCFHAKEFCLFCQVGSGVERLAGTKTDNRGRARQRERRVSFKPKPLPRDCVACARKLKVADAEHCPKCLAHGWVALQLELVA